MNLSYSAWLDSSSQGPRGVRSGDCYSWPFDHTSLEEFQGPKLRTTVTTTRKSRHRKLIHSMAAFVRADFTILECTFRDLNLPQHQN